MTPTIELITTRWSGTDPRHVIEVDDPATGEVFARIAGGGAARVDAAVAAARAAQPGWAARTPRERGRILTAVAAEIRRHADEIAELESREMGKPVSQARQFDVASCSEIFDFFGRVVESLPQQVGDRGYALDVSLLEPHGVIGAVLPFNWPPIHTAGKVAPALAVGNAIVVKPPEQCPLVVLRVLELIASVVGDDVVHAVPGGAEAGAALTAHPGIDMLSFTGSPVTGRHVLRAAAENLTPALMELGGKNALVVFDDADLDVAVGAAIEGGFFNQGEACTAASRVVVQRGLHDHFVERLGDAVRRLKVGRGTDPAVHVGPLVDDAARRKVRDYLAVGVAEGARVAASAPLPDDPELRGGYFVEPTLFTDVTPTMRIATEEIFGPVVAVIPFDDEDEAVAIANGTEFGLTAGVFTADARRQLRMSRRLRAGMVFVNNYNRNVIGMPFGGVGSSGFGREHSVQTLLEYGYTKTVRMPSGLAPIPVWQAVADTTSPQ